MLMTPELEALQREITNQRANLRSLFRIHNIGDYTLDYIKATTSSFLPATRILAMAHDGKRLLEDLLIEAITNHIRNPQ